MFFCCFEPLLGVWGWVKFCQKLKVSMNSFLSEISDFDQFLNIVISDLWVNCKYQNDILKRFFSSFKCSLDDLNDFWKFEDKSNFVKNWKFHDRGPERNFGFWPLFEHCISDLWVNCKYQNCILKCSLVYLKDLWKFDVELKFCQKLKIFITAVLSEISDFHHFLNIVISDLWVNCKNQMIF